MKKEPLNDNSHKYDWVEKLIMISTAVLMIAANVFLLAVLTSSI